MRFYKNRFEDSMEQKTTIKTFSKKSFDEIFNHLSLKMLIMQLKLRVI